MEINYTRANVSKAVFHLVTADEPMPRRSWDAYMIATRGPVRDGLENEFAQLEAIFGGIRHDEVQSKLRIEVARRGASILLEMHDAFVARTAALA